MKQTIKERLKRYTFIFSLLYHKILHLKLRKQILKNLQQKDSVFFVQVGSNDGVQGDPLHELITVNKKWKEIFIEPVGFL